MSETNTKKKHFLFRPPWRVFTFLIILYVIIQIPYLIWTPGYINTNKNINKKQNALWLSHGWIGADQWFIQYKKDKHSYRTIAKFKELNARIKKLNINYLFPHLCPSKPNGKICDYNDEAIQLLLSKVKIKVLPWIGGVLNSNAYPNLETWQKNFIDSIKLLLAKHPTLAGVHVNIEPMPNGNKDFILLLKDIKAAIGENKILSVASYPPPTWMHPYESVHWSKTYYQSISIHIDQHVVMMYDTALTLEKPYQHLYSQWVTEVLAWSIDKEVLFGIPAYDDKNAGYHTPEVENIKNALKGLYPGLENTSNSNYNGIAIYCNWELDQKEEELIYQNFIK